MKKLDEIFRLALTAEIEGLGRGAQKRLAGEVGVIPTYISHLCLGRRQGTEELRRKIARSLGYDYEDFLDLGRSLAEGLGYEECEKPEPQSPPQLNLDDYLTVDFYEDLKVAAGRGGFIPQPDEQLGPPVLIHRRELGRRARHKLASFRVGGPSMEPTIALGALVVVDLDDRQQLDSQGIYLVWRQDEEDCAVKRVQPVSDRQMLLLSDNPLFKPELIDTRGHNPVVGRIILSWNNHV